MNYASLISVPPLFSQDLTQREVLARDAAERRGSEHQAPDVSFSKHGVAEIWVTFDYSDGTQRTYNGERWL